MKEEHLRWGKAIESGVKGRSCDGAVEEKEAERIGGCVVAVVAVATFIKILSHSITDFVTDYRQQLVAVVCVAELQLLWRVKLSYVILY